MAANGSRSPPLSVLSGRRGEDLPGATVTARFLQDLLQVIEASGRDMPRHLVQSFSFEGPATISSQWVPRLMPDAVLQSLRPQWGQLPSTREAIQFWIAEDTLRLPEMTKAGAPYKPVGPDLEQCILEGLEKFAATYLEEFETFQVEEALFDRHYRQWREVWHSSALDRTVTVPLLGTEPLGKTVDIEPDLSLVPLTDEMKGHLCEANTFGSALCPPSAIAGCSVAVQARYRSPHPMRSGSSEVGKAIRAVVLSLRLLRSGGVRPLAAVDRPPFTHLRAAASTQGAEFESHQSNFFGSFGRYALTAEDGEALGRIYSEVRRAQARPEYSHLVTAVTRFEGAYSRGSVEDRLIDLSIALECTLLFGCQNELSYRLGIRGAYLLRGVRDPNDTARFLKTLYNVRSSILHEGKRLFEIAKKGKIPGRPVLGLDGEAASVVRAVLFEYVAAVARGESVSAFTESIDAGIAGSFGGPG